MSTDVPLYAVILAGGSGTRFWPASREARPKQFLPISGGSPMIRETFERLEGLVPAERVLVITAEHQVELVREALPELPTENVLGEPSARNTAAAVALAAHELSKREEHSVQAVLAADHVIDPAEDFRSTLQAATVQATQSSCLLTFGVKPTYPATGYGYIEVDGQIGDVHGVPVFAVQRFVEKPDVKRATEFLETKRFWWNSGIFVWSTASILDAFGEHVPEIRKGLRKLAKGKALEDVYPTLPSLPIDVAVMERAKNVRMMPIEYRWNDVGSWSAIAELSEPDAAGNWPALSGGAKLIAEDSKGCVAYAEGDHLIALLGVEDLVVVRTEDATLVCPRSRAQDVRRIVERLKEGGSPHL